MQLADPKRQLQFSTLSPQGCFTCLFVLFSSSEQELTVSLSVFLREVCKLIFYSRTPSIMCKRFSLNYLHQPLLEEEMSRGHGGNHKVIMNLNPSYKLSFLKQIIARTGMEHGKETCFSPLIMPHKHLCKLELLT